MAVLTADAERNAQDGELVEYQVKGSTTIYKGAFVSTDATGYLVPGADAAGQIFAGTAYEAGDNSAGADGAVKVRVIRGNVQETAKATAVIADVGALMYLLDDNSVGLTGDTVNTILVGRCVKLISSAKVLVDTGDRV